jgi:uncharacterized protein (DUF934 family)
MDKPDLAAEAPVAERDEAPESQPAFTLEAWIAAGNPADLAITIRGDEAIAAQLDALTRLSTIVIEFPAFTDGRGYSMAKQLRDRGFAGKLYAAGDILPDQWQYLKRCGFTGLLAHKLADDAAQVPGISVMYQQGLVD